ncbi:unnamed protein product [Microthlaspi erraticum]|uniref:Uncharacterized protein n=1 Tax=Microthlaspi erraticum TaxID=1685480 RepID=A0A6D2I0K6_9BRAS|nr:unnamed protein product [Microthlaspi erraticum]
MGHEEHGGTWHMDAAQLDTQRKKGEAILKTSSTVYSTNRSSSSTRPAKLQLDRAEKHSGNPLSWRGRRNDHFVRCRLERALSNSEWAELYPSGRCEHLRFEGSDHRPVVSYFDPNRQKKKGLFRYDRRLKDNDEVKALITKVWEEASEANLNQKIIQCRRALINWSKSKHLDSQKRIEELKQGIEAEISSASPNEELSLKRNEELRHAYNAEEAFWKQRSRQLSLQLGDHNTTSFHAATRARFAINKFSVLENDAGDVIYEEEQMLQPLPLEIKEALFGTHPDKAPGPDGFSASIFQSNWNIVGADIVSDVQGFFSSGVMARSSNETHIRLIPKILAPKKVADYRPIALCNVCYKIISKLLARRPQPLLDGIISENQSAFVPKRAISDNVLITHEVLHFLKV